MKGRRGPPRGVMILGAVAILLFVLIQGSTPDPVNWTQSFVGRHTIPYGTAVLRDLLPSMVEGGLVIESTQSAYLAANDIPPDATWLILNDRFAPDEYETGALLDHAWRGGTVMVIAGELGETFADTLKLDVDRSYSGADTIGVRLVNPALAGERFELVQKSAGSDLDNTFIDFDTLDVTVLGTTDSSDVNALAIDYGRGRIIVNLLPHAFTNYQLLKRDGMAYATSFLRYIPRSAPLVWDEFYKSGRELATSPLRYVLGQSGLRWAFWLTVIGILLAVVFMGRRTQRAIPIVAPPANATLQFAETIAQLYRRRADHRDLAAKKRTYTMESLRHRYGIAPTVRGEELVRTIAARAGIERDRAAAMIAAFDWIEKSETVGEDDLLELAQTVDRTLGERREQRRKRRA